MPSSNKRSDSRHKHLLCLLALDVDVEGAVLDVVVVFAIRNVVVVMDFLAVVVLTVQGVLAVRDVVVVLVVLAIRDVFAVLDVVIADLLRALALGLLRVVVALPPTRRRTSTPSAQERKRAHETPAGSQVWCGERIPA